MPYLIDTCVLIDFSRHHHGAERFFTQLKEKPALSVLTITEFSAGIKKQYEHHVMDNIIVGANIYDIDQHIALLAGTYLNQYSKKYGVGIVDSLLAATAKIYKLTLATHNTKHFPMLNKKEVIAPY